MKTIVIRYIIYPLAKFVPLSVQVKILTQIINSVSLILPPKKSLQFLFDLGNQLYVIEGLASIRYGKGIHTKHKHIKYHDFFIKNIKSGDKVLDIGSGNGYLSYDIARKISKARVLGIELNKINFEFAVKNFKHPNLNFIKGDVLKDLPNEKFNVVVLSNVLEHFKKRVEFLKLINKKIKPDSIIIRVPFYERDWRVPLKEEIGVDYRLDPTHFIEYKQQEYIDEISKAGFKVKCLQNLWGEIWSVVEPRNN